MKIFKISSVLCALILFAFNANSQIIHDSLGIPENYEMYQQAISQTCTFPQSEVVSVVTTKNNGAFVYLKFLDLNLEGTSFNYSPKGGGATTPFSIEGNEKVISGLPLEEEFVVNALDACGDWVQVASFSTKFDRDVQGIDVSNKLYGFITHFQGLGESDPFPQALESADFHIMEKVSFIQSYYYKGKHLEGWDGSTHIGPPPPPPPSGGECICNFVLNRSKNITPISPFGHHGRRADGSIYPFVQTDGEDHLPGATKGHTQWWEVKSSKGAARYHQFWTEGFKAGGANQSHLTDDTNNGAPSYTSASNSALLRYNLFCQNLAYLPEDCQCDKPLRLYYGYDVEVNTYAAKRNGGVGSRNAFAVGHDMSAAVFHVDGSSNYGVLQTLDVRHESECDRTANPTFWVNWGMIALRATALAYSLRDQNFTFIDSIAFSQSTNNFQSALTTAANTPYWSSNGCDDNGNVTGNMAGDTLVYLRPNEPVTLYIFAYGKLQTGGKRSWHSTSRILSDFYLAGYLPGGPLANQELHCCSPKIADWLLASIPGAPVNEPTLKSTVSTIFNAFAPWNTAAGFSALTEWGHDIVQIHPECDLGTDEPGDPGNLVGNPDDRGDSGFAAPVSYSIIDQTGRVVWTTKSTLDKADFLIQVRKNRLNFRPGVYFLNCASASSFETEKFYIH